MQEMNLIVYDVYDLVKKTVQNIRVYLKHTSYGNNLIKYIF